MAQMPPPIMAEKAGREDLPPFYNNHDEITEKKSMDKTGLDVNEAEVREHYYDPLSKSRVFVRVISPHYITYGKNMADKFTSQEQTPTMSTPRKKRCTPSAESPTESPSPRTSSHSSNSASDSPTTGPPWSSPTLSNDLFPLVPGPVRVGTMVNPELWVWGKRPRSG